MIRLQNARAVFECLRKKALAGAVLNGDPVATTPIL